ncbi:transcriptional regulator [Acaryochloris sp. IP29b_bin.137]|uniref:helix-turn-helix domain-containing protein n=1 Tax=Acaryochloris sp. IP29b_bin.137 TaxID=2969217 RepID=UPI00261C4A23|nr:transcriptional regulator [Acaryochloris sp. IP29b_bin.137]
MDKAIHRKCNTAKWQNLCEVRETFDRSSYDFLLSHYRPLPIRSEEDNEAALKIVAELSRRDDLTPAEEDLLELLTQLIEHFEEQHYSFPEDMKAGPLDFLLELAQSNGLRQADFVGVIGSRGVVSEVFNGKRGISNSKSMARALGHRFKIDPGVFL